MSIERNHEQVDLAKTGEEVCIKIENTTGEAPKLYGRHFTHEDTLVSRVSIINVFLFINIVRNCTTTITEMFKVARNAFIHEKALLLSASFLIIRYVLSSKVFSNLCFD